MQVGLVCRVPGCTPYKFCRSEHGRACWCPPVHFFHARSEFFLKAANPSFSRLVSHRTFSGGFRLFICSFLPLILLLFRIDARRVLPGYLRWFVCLWPPELSAQLRLWVWLVLSFEVECSSWKFQPISSAGVSLRALRAASRSQSCEVGLEKGFPKLPHRNALYLLLWAIDLF